MDEDEEDDELFEYELLEYRVALRQQIAHLHWIHNELTSLLHSITRIAEQLQEQESLLQNIRTWGCNKQLSPTGSQVLLDGTWVSVYTAIGNFFTNI